MEGNIKPVRIQRKRTKDFSLQAASPNGLPVVYVGRPTVWGNPFKLYRDGTAEECIIKYREMIENNFYSDVPALGRFFEHSRFDLELKELRGKNLACWCRDDFPFCHADVLLELANK